MGRGIEMFKSNNCVAIHLEDIKAAENFYTNVMKFRLLTRSEASLEYDTGHFLLYVNKDLDTRPPIPSFSVADIEAAKLSLLENGCVILREDTNSLYFRDPFGITYDVIQGK
jgi:catechol 2,3-dioxygenase-like lactoylglutathione lyase family enzyme